MTQPLDGNAVAGELFVHFGAEMTQAVGACGHCGASAILAELSVYRSGPGSVARCVSCGSVVIVAVEIRDTTRVHMSAFELDRTNG